MPFLDRQKWLNKGGVNATREANRSHFEGLQTFTSGMFVHCANTACRSGWMHLFRDRTRPIFEGGWTCSPECTEALLELAVRREREGWTASRVSYQHRIPLGLLMFEKGWITSEQLRSAVQAQKESGKHRIGEWLVELGAADESAVTHALSLQWGCPVLARGHFDPVIASRVMPKLFLEMSKVVPVRVAAGKILYLGYEEGVDPALSFAMERITGLRVESGIVASSLFSETLKSALRGTFPTLQMAEAATSSAAARMLAKTIERSKPIESRLVRFQDWLWLRMFLFTSTWPFPEASSMMDVLCSFRSF